MHKDSPFVGAPGGAELTALIAGQNRAAAAALYRYVMRLTCVAIKNS